MPPLMPLVPPTLLAMGACIELGLACFAKELAELIDPAKDADKDVAVTYINGGADLATLAMIIQKAQKYLLVINSYEDDPVFTGSGQDALNKYDAYRKEASPYESLIYPVIIGAEVTLLTAGFDAPYNGADIKAGTEAQLLRSLGGRLNSALPDSANWEGLAAQNYAGKVQGIEQIIDRLIEIDQQLADCAQRQAEIINNIRLGLGVLKGLCAAACFYSQVYAASGNLAGLKSFEFKIATLGMLGLAAIIACAKVFSQKEGKTASERAQDYCDLFA